MRPVGGENIIAYHQDGHVIRVSPLLEPAEGADVVPALDDRTEVARAERSGGWCGANPGGVVAVDRLAPAGQSLQERELSQEVKTYCY